MKVDWHNDWWQKGYIPFHREDVHPYLLQFYEKLKLEDRSTILFPLCGKSLDMTYLASKGHHVVGADLSSTAFTEFATESGFEFDSTQLNGFEKHSTNNLDYFVGDFFALASEELPTIDLIYDRGSLVALDEGLRKRYLETVKNLPLSQNAQLLIYSFEHNGPADPAPPFTLSLAQINSYFSDEWTIEILLQEQVMPSAHMEKYQITLVDRTLYLLQKKKYVGE